MTIGQRIHARRKELNLTMKAVFEKENINTGNLSELEHDKYLPSVQTLISLGRALDCSIDWLLTGKEHHTVEKKSLQSDILNTERKSLCDGTPLAEQEADLVAMFRLLPSLQQEELFDLVYFKYERYVEQKNLSIYWTYLEEESETNKKSDSSQAPKTSDSIA